jgi:arylsulfatase B
MKYGLLKLFVAVCCITITCTASAQKHEKPNIIIILADDLGWGDVGFHESNIKTPNIDKLAREGVILNHYYTAPVCSPTRAGLLTGRYPNRFGLRQTVIPPWSSFGVNRSEELLPVMLAEAGYQNRAILGKWHLGHAKREFLPLQRGFTHFYGHYNGAIDYFSHKREGELDWHNDESTSYDTGYTTDLLTKEAVKCIENYSKTSPFFLYIAYNAPHGPLQAKDDDLLLYGYDKSLPRFGRMEGYDDSDGYGAKGKGNNPRQTYSAMVTNLDRGIGQILDKLKEMGIDDNTLVLFHSDNGAAPNEGGTSGDLRGLKFQEWDGGVRAPAIVKWPAGFKGGRTLEQVMGYIDIAPTLREIIGIKGQPSKPYDGLSMLPVWKGDKKSIDRTLYLGYGSVIVNDWKLVKANAGNEKMKHKEDLLFAIMKDPSEKKNLRDANPGIYEKLNNIVTAFDAIQSSDAVPPYGEGRKNFKAPKEWKIID